MEHKSWSTKVSGDRELSVTQISQSVNLQPAVQIKCTNYDVNSSHPNYLHRNTVILLRSNLECCKLDFTKTLNSYRGGETSRLCLASLKRPIYCLSKIVLLDTVLVRFIVQLEFHSCWVGRVASHYKKIPNWGRCFPQTQHILLRLRLCCFIKNMCSGLIPNLTTRGSC